MAGEIPDLGRAELEALQLQRLRDTLRRAHAHVPHYRAAHGRRLHVVRPRHLVGAEPWTDEMRLAVQERSGIRAVGAARNPV